MKKESKISNDVEVRHTGRYDAHFEEVGGHLHE